MLRLVRAYVRPLRTPGMIALVVAEVQIANNEFGRDMYCCMVFIPITTTDSTTPKQQASWY